MTKKLIHPRREYLRGVLEESTVNPNPFGQFEEWYRIALEAGTDEPNAMVLSTAAVDGRVSARVVLLKGIDERGFTFFTNYNSRKGIQLSKNPFAALTFHWRELERQVRIEGRVRKVSRKESVAYFNQRPLDSRISACISPQSSVIPDRYFLEGMKEGFMLDLMGKEPECPAEWGGYRMIPDMIEFWQGRENRLHDRLRFTLKRGEWTLQRLAP